MSAAVDRAALEAVVDSLSLEPPTDAPGLLVWLDERAEALREVRTRLAQDAAAEKLRRQRWAARQEEAEARATRMETDIQRACEAMRHVLLPGATKSRQLPGGACVAFRRRPMRLEVRDGDALFAWALTRGMARTVQVADMDAVRAAFNKGQGEIPDGCDVSGGDESFRITTNGENE